jgi:WhiB family transcriptional regulator, redox-sensing transcriptional regulator
MSLTVGLRRTGSRRASHRSAPHSGRQPDNRERLKGGRPARTSIGCRWLPPSALAPKSATDRAPPDAPPGAPPRAPSTRRSRSAPYLPSGRGAGGAAREKDRGVRWTFNPCRRASPRGPGGSLTEECDLGGARQAIRDARSLSPGLAGGTAALIPKKFTPKRVWFSTGCPCLNKCLVGDETTDTGELLELMARPEWHRRAACRGRIDVTWFPVTRTDQKSAQKVCAGCEVRRECLDWSLSQPPELDGIWGGLGHRARQRVLRAQQV